MELSPEEIFEKNVVWVAGGYIMAKKELLPTFISQYRRASSTLISLGMADTDQQVLASMYSPQMIQEQQLLLKTYACPRGAFGLFGYGYLYYCLAFICRATDSCQYENQVI